MSTYTEAEHAIALSDTLYWIDHPPINAEDRFKFGQYHFRLKDYSEAYHWFSIAAESGYISALFDMGICLHNDLLNEGDSSDNQRTLCQNCFLKVFSYYKRKTSLPDCSSEDIYRLAFLYRYGLGTTNDLSKAFFLFKKVTDMHMNLTVANFDICCNYSYEGANISTPTDACKLPVGNSYYELGKYYDKGLAPVIQDTSKARTLYKKAYDFHCENALLYDYSNFCNNFASYEYQNDIKELYSYHIGLYIRVCEIHPSKKAYERIIAMYEGGYPGDSGERKTAFKQKAERFYKKMETLPS